MDKASWWRPCLAARNQVVRYPRLGPRPLEIAHDDRVDLRIQRLDPRDRSVAKLSRAEALPLQAGGKLGRGACRKLTLKSHDPTLAPQSGRARRSLWRLGESPARNLCRDCDVRLRSRGMGFRLWLAAGTG